ncbi:MAG: HD-GYP domain-containing protein [Thermoleophilaceae bacterium]
MARTLALPDEQVDRVRHAAELHDVGKVAIPDEILNTPSPLAEHEWEFIRRHTLIGERIIAAAPALVEVASLDPRALGPRRLPRRADGDRDPPGVADSGGRRRL